MIIARMIVPSTIRELDQIIADALPESIHLDYKASAALAKDSSARTELAKDVSAFANADGGVLIYGIEERQHRPIRRDDGVKTNEITKEWLESIILTTITPRIDDIRIYPIPSIDDRTYYVIHVPKTVRGPHQCLVDKKYYKRHNFMNQAMENYEINDVRQRSRDYPPLVTLRISEYAGFVAVIDILNERELPAEDVVFEFSENLAWDKETPTLFRNGIKRLMPRQHFRFRYQNFHKILAEHAIGPKQFSCRITYGHPALANRISDEWHVDFEAYMQTMIYKSDSEYYTKRGIDALEKLANNLDQINRTIKGFGTIAGASGLDLSLGTIINLRRAIHNEDPEAIDPRWQPHGLFRELLNVDWNLASRLERICHTDNLTAEDIKSIEGMTDKLYEKFIKHFSIPSRSE